MPSKVSRPSLTTDAISSIITKPYEEMTIINSSNGKSTEWSEKNNGSCEALTKASDGHGKLSYLAASVFIVGEMGGGGILTLPYAVSGCGWTGILLIALCCLSAAQAAIYLGRCWCIIEEKWPEYKAMQSDPYSVIGLKAFGRKTQILVSFSVFVQLYGVATVFLALCSDLIVVLLKGVASLPFQLTTCQMAIIVGVIALPLMLLPTPAEISFIAYTAMSCTVISCVLLLVMFGLEVDESRPTPPPPTITLDSCFLSLSTFAFVYGGAATFPTFQNFMQDKSKFPHAIFTGFTMMLVLYIPIAAGGFALFGGNVEQSIMDNLPNTGIKTAISVLMAFHLFSALLIVINPVNMAFEETLGFPGRKLSLGKSITRTLMGLSMIAVVLTIPKFDKIMNLVGATTVSTTSFVFPPIFYLSLTQQNHQEKKISLWTKVICCFISILGLVGAVIATYFAVKDIIGPDAFTKPCYV